MFRPLSLQPFQSASQNYLRLRLCGLLIESPFGSPLDSCHAFAAHLSPRGDSFTLTSPLIFVEKLSPLLCAVLFTHFPLVSTLSTIPDAYALFAILICALTFPDKGKPPKAADNGDIIAEIVCSPFICSFVYADALVEYSHNKRYRGYPSVPYPPEKNHRVLRSVCTVTRHASCQHKQQ